MRYLVILLDNANGKPLYAVVDQKKFFTNKRKALKECCRLNEVEESINRAFELAAKDKKRKEQSND